jgi:hypothetical protein
VPSRTTTATPTARETATATELPARLLQLVGHEAPLAEVAQALHFAAKDSGADPVGALLVHCADESEHECAEAFQQGFVRHLLPPLKFARQAAMRIATLGARYEWGAARIAEQHFRREGSRAPFKLLLVKINAHVAYEEASFWDRAGSGKDDTAPFRFGGFKRYGLESTSCGALGALLGGAPEPFAEDLREVFLSEGLDRLALLGDPERVDPLYRALYAAIVSARLQARKAVLDLQDWRPSGPTRYVIVPSVTLDRHDRDTEIVCGLYRIEASGVEGDEPRVTYTGLGDDPSAYRIDRRNRRFIVVDEHAGQSRAGRDHRDVVREVWSRRAGAAAEALPADERLDRLRRDVDRNKHRDHHHARTLLRAALPILAEVAPVPAAVLMFAEGAVGIHHAFRVHKLAREMEGSDEARRILGEIHDRVDALPPERAEAMIELLLRDYRA